MSDQTLRAAKMIARAISDKSKSRGGESVEESGEPQGGGLPTRFQGFNWNSVGKDLTDEAFANALFGNARVFVPCTPLAMPSGQAFKFSYGPLRAPPDRGAYALLRNQPAWADKYLKYAIGVVCCNGTRKGQLTRLQARLKKPFEVDMRKLRFDYLAKHIPMRKFDFDTLGELSPDNPVIELNPIADTGFPMCMTLPKGSSSMCKVQDLVPTQHCKHQFYIPVGDTQKRCPTCAPAVDIGFNLANDYLREIKRLSEMVDKKEVDLVEGLNRFMKLVESRPDEFTALFKKKFERIPVEDVLSKVRTYSVFPLSLKILFNYVIHPIKSSMMNFVENQDSNVCNNFTPFYGGANKMMARIMDFVEDSGKVFDTNPKKFVCFLGFAYGDDHLWVFVFRNGKILIATPDVSSMDLSTSPDLSSYFALFYLNYEFQNAPTWWKLSLMIWATMSTSGRTHIDGVFNAYRLSGLFSGIHGTTEMNMTNSVHIHSIISGVESLCSDENSFAMSLAICMDKVRKNLGYDFKRGDELIKIGMDKKSSLDDLLFFKEFVFLFNDENDLYEKGIPLPFLSNKIVKEEGRYIFVPYELEKFGATIVHPKSNLKSPVEIEINRIERFKGAYYSGAWYDEELAEFLRSSVNVKNLFNDKLEVEGLSVCGQDDISEVIQFCNQNGLFEHGKHLPSREFMIDFCGLSKDDFRIKWKERAHISAIPLQQQPAESVVSRPTTPTTVTSGDATFAPTLVPRAFAAMRGAFTTLAMTEAVPLQSAGQVTANTKVEKYNKDRARERARKEKEEARMKKMRELNEKLASRSSAFARRAQGTVTLDEEDDIRLRNADDDAKEQYEYEQQMREYVREQYEDDYSEPDTEELDDEQEHYRHLIDDIGVDEGEEVDRLMRIFRAKKASGLSVRGRKRK